MPTFTRWHTELAEKIASGIPLEQRIPFVADCIRPPGEKTGWPPGMLQDDDRRLSVWLANRIDSRMHAREAVEAIEAGRDEVQPLTPEVLREMGLL